MTTEIAAAILVYCKRVHFFSLIFVSVLLQCSLKIESLFFSGDRSSRMNATTRTGSLSGDETSSDDDSSEDEAFTDLKTLAAQADLPNDFWQVRWHHPTTTPTKYRSVFFSKGAKSCAILEDW